MRLVTVNYAPSTAFMNRFTLIDGLTLGLGVDSSVRAYWKSKAVYDACNPDGIEGSRSSIRAMLRYTTLCFATSIP